MFGLEPMTTPDSIPFTKLEGLGNDFVLIDHFAEPLAPAGAPSSPSSMTPELARVLLDRRFGIGGDQLLWLRPPFDAAQAHARMEILNPDGSTAEMCGNGIRAFALYFDKKQGAQAPRRYRIETMAGIKTVEVIRSTPGSEWIRVDMGSPRLGSGVAAGGEELSLLGGHPKFYEVNMGNPHAVFFSAGLDRTALERPLMELAELGPELLGPAIERHSRFPERTNVEFVQVLAQDAIRVRVWERGTGLTLACGTGACASAVAALASGRVLPSGAIRVELPGGELKIFWDPRRPEDAVFMEGPAREVFRGEFFRYRTT
jgi:diaminopimelate epimerase